MDLVLFPSLSCWPWPHFGIWVLLSLIFLSISFPRLKTVSAHVCPDHYLVEYLRKTLCQSRENSLFADLSSPVFCLPNVSALVSLDSQFHFNSRVLQPLPVFLLSVQWSRNFLKATNFGNPGVPSFVCHLFEITIFHCLISNNLKIIS